jgi:hypothetical protein
MGNFSHNQKKLEYAYLLTPSGKSKEMLTAQFLQLKAAEYAMLKSELEKKDKYEKHAKRLGRGEVMENVGGAVQ